MRRFTTASLALTLAATGVLTAAAVVAQDEEPSGHVAEPTRPQASKGGGTKVALLIVGVLVLAAVGVATGWFLTQ